MEEQRRGVDYRFKLLYAFGMIFIVAGHASGGGVSLFYDWFPVYGFHLGLFAFCSGYFYRDEQETDIPGYVLRKARRLLLPMYLWNLFYALLVVILSRFGFTIGLAPSFRTLVTLPLYDGSQFEFNMGAWFVVPLFTVQVLNVLLRRVTPGRGPRREIALFLVDLALGVAGVSLTRAGFHRGWEVALVRALYFLPFYGGGILYRRVLEKHDRLPHSLYFALVFLAQYLIIILCGRIPTYIPSRMEGFAEGGVVPFLVGFVGIAFWLRVAKLLEHSLGRDRLLNAIADNSYAIMVNQFLGFFLLNTGFALLRSVTGLAQAFDLAEYHSNVVYFYTPGGRIFLLFYLAAGLLVPIGMQKLVDLGKRALTRKRAGASAQ